MNQTVETTSPVEIKPIVIPVKQPDELTSIVERINWLSEEIQTNDLLSKKHGVIAVQLVIETGGLLWDCREKLKHGDWMKWVMENIKHLSYETVNRYIRLFELSHVTDLKDCESLREAYILTGILKVPIVDEEKDNNPNSPPKQKPKSNFIPNGNGGTEPVITEIPFDKVKRLEQELRTVFVENENVGYYDEMVKLLVPLVQIHQKHIQNHESPEPERVD